MARKKKVKEEIVETVKLPEPEPYTKPFDYEVGDEVNHHVFENLVKSSRTGVIIDRSKVDRFKTNVYEIMNEADQTILSIPEDWITGKVIK